MVLEPEGRGASGRDDYGGRYRKFTSSGRNDRSGHNDLLSIGADGKGNVSTVTATHHRSDSTDAIVPKTDVELAPMAGVFQQTTIEVTHEPAYPEENASGSGSGRSRVQSPENPEKGKRTFFRF